MEQKLVTSRGFPLPFGASTHSKGVNFSIFSKHASALSLVLFEPDHTSPYQEIPLDPNVNKTGDIWHIFIYDLPLHLQYGYRVDGPYDPLKGFFYDKRCILLDPYAKHVASSHEWGRTATKSLQTKGFAQPLEPFHWEDDRHPHIPFNELVIYEMHVRGFTQDRTSHVQYPGTYLGIIEKIPYLQALGINAVELMPIHEFNERDNPHTNPKTGEQLYQYWGYSTVNYFSVMNRYSTGRNNALNEFKTMVKALHKAGIEVILDVVYNHTSEGNEQGHIQSFKGFENPTYYLLGPNGEYYNFSGCGNTLNCNNPVVRELIRDSLRFWVTEMHVDGFRFDLASILARDHDGIPMQRPPLVEAITLDPVLADTKLIAEAWDAGGLYQVGNFPGLRRWAEWNGPYRDSVRRFLKGTEGEAGAFATRLAGSEDLYGKGRFPYHSINFITAHDGFTLADLVSYNEKHNEENGENNRDGTNDNESWNCGCEGLATDEKVNMLRKRQMRNFMLALFVSQGVPMLLMGDEYGHTKLGNNNTWCHDSRLNWFQWDTLEKSQDFFRYCQLLIAFRKSHPALTHSRFLKENDVAWHGKEFFKPDWSPKSRFLALSLLDPVNNYCLYIAFNAQFEESTFRLPPKDPQTPWKVIVDTSKSSPEDIVEEERAIIHTPPTYTLPSYSALLLKRQLH